MAALLLPSFTDAQIDVTQSAFFSSNRSFNDFFLEPTVVSFDGGITSTEIKSGSVTQQGFGSVTVATTLIPDEFDRAKVVSGAVTKFSYSLPTQTFNITDASFTPIGSITISNFTINFDPANGIGAVGNFNPVSYFEFDGVLSSQWVVSNNAVVATGTLTVDFLGGDDFDMFIDLSTPAFNPSFANYYEAAVDPITLQRYALSMTRNIVLPAAYPGNPFGVDMSIAYSVNTPFGSLSATAYPTLAAAVPEPATAATVIGMALGTLVVGRRRLTRTVEAA